MTKILFIDSFILSYINIKGEIYLETNQEKLNKFERLAEKRVADTLKKMQLISNLANKKNYEYTDKHVKQIVDALETELKLLKARFSEESTERNIEFKFKK